MAGIQMFDISGGIQTATTWLLRQQNEVEDAENYRFDGELGGAERRPGYSLFQQLATSKFPLGFFEAKFKGGVKIFYAYNNSGNTATELKCYDPVTTTITTVKNDYPPNCKLQMVMNAGELYVAGITTDTGARQQIVNIQENLTVSNYRNLYTSPKAAFIGENSGALYAMNVELNGVVYPDRAYISSPQRGAMTYVNAAMNNTYAPVDLVNEIPKMTSNTAPFGTAAASTENGGVWLAYGAFDRTAVRSPGQAWFSNVGPPAWLRYDFGVGASKVITHYAVTAITGNPSNPNDTNGAPKDWTFEGSNDASSWTVIQTITNQTAWATSETRTFQTSNTTGYRYYRINISANNGFASYVNIAEMAMYSSVQTTREMQVKVDSARYVKAGMEIDIYKAGTDTKLYTITPTSVNKAKDTFNFLPYNLNVSAVNATNNTITVSSAALFTTGTPVLLQSTGTVPGGLTAGTTYYAINDGTNNLKLAGSLSDAKIGANIDLTSTGSGVITLFMSYIMEKTDELWLKDRHGDGTPSLFWNTDYRSEQTADFIFIAAGKVADTAITGWAKSNNRLNMFTKTSMWQYDNANFLPVFEDIGCISHDTICNNGTWIIWLDATGKVRARDSSSGQDQIISRAVKNKWLSKLLAANLLGASAVMFDGNYKLAIGQMDNKYIRLVYNFDMNIWWRESHKRMHVYGINSSISGTRKSYFLDQNGNMYLDEDGNLDDTDTIPRYIVYGRRNFGNGLDKGVRGMYVYAINASGAAMMMQKPGNDTNWETIGQLKDVITRIEIPDNKSMVAQDFNFKIAHNTKGDPDRIEGIELWANEEQSNF